MPFWDLGHPLWEVDDARYAQVPAEMAATGRWLTPTLNHIDYIEKPPLIYWLSALSYKAFGISEAAARLPLAALTMLGLAATAWLGWWMFSPRAGLWAAVMLATSIEFSILSHLQTPDTALSVFLLWATALILRGLHRPEEARWCGPAAGIAVALAFLSKGLVGIAFPAVWLAMLMQLFPAYRIAGRQLAARGGAAVALLVVPWVAAMTLQHPEFPHLFFVEQHFLRYVTPLYNRTGPWHYFITCNLAGTLPWTPLVLAGLAAVVIKWKEAPRGAVELFLWIGFVFCFFTASSSKLPTYILPLLPHQFLLAAALATRAKPGSAFRRAAAQGAKWLGAVVLAAIPAAAMLYPAGVWHPAAGRPIAAVSLAAAAALAWSLWALATMARRPMEKALSRTAVAAMAITAFILLGARLSENFVSAKQLGADISADYAEGDRIITYDLYLQGLPFYAGKPVDVIVNWIGELHFGKRLPRFQARFGDDNTIAGLRKGEGSTFIVLRHKLLPFFKKILRTEIRRTKVYGNWVLVVL